MKLPKVITGQEELENPQHPLNAVIAYYNAFNARDVETVANNWAKKYSIAMVNPTGGIRRNWNAVKEYYKKLMDDKVRIYLEIHDLKYHQFESIFYIEGRERGSVESGTDQLGLKLRTSRIYKLFEEGWEQIHQHASIDDAELLERYKQDIFQL